MGMMAGDYEDELFATMGHGGTDEMLEKMLVHRDFYNGS
jgi:hypothetical protein